jgi:hypothetical protein
MSMCLARSRPPLADDVVAPIDAFIVVHLDWRAYCRQESHLLEERAEVDDLRGSTAAVDAA